MAAVSSPAVRTDDRLEFVEYRQRTSEFIPLYEPVVTEEMRQAVLRGYDEKLWIRGSRTWESQGKKFEEEVCRFIGCDYAVNMTSGTAALLLALKAFGIGAGDEVITVPNTFPEKAEPIEVRICTSPATAKPMPSVANDSNHITRRTRAFR